MVGGVKSTYVVSLTLVLGSWRYFLFESMVVVMDY
jgi:hypothetical protein